MIRKILTIILNVLLCIVLGVAIILGLAFTFIEGRLLFSGDWLIYNNPFYGFIRYFFRTLLALGFITYCVIEIIYLFRYNRMNKFIVMAIRFSFITFSFVLVFNATNGLGIIYALLQGTIYILIGLHSLVRTKISK